LERIGDKKEFDKIKNFYNKTKGGHRDVAHYDVYTVYKLSIDTMSEAFKNKGSKVGNIKRLWHGTKASNMLSILKGGMIIPKGYGGTIQVTGRMFGDGLYFSDQSTKAIRYATGAWGGGGSSDRKFMFLVDVAMGNEYFPSGWSGNLTLPRGYHSCFAKAGRSGVMNNEMIVYNTAQANPVYIVEFTPYGRK
jgi:poly [ADP-ribose] polymerase